MDPKKVQDIIEIPPPHNIRQMRGHQGHLQSIQWFISQLADKSQTFTKTLHKGVTYDWNEDCDKGIAQIK